MKNLIFAFRAASGSSELEALILARSIRAFAGAFSDRPIWILVPEAGDGISEGAREELVSLHARLVPFKIDPDVSEFPFAVKVFAAAAAERLAGGQADGLAWMDSDSIVVREPKALLLSDGKSLG